MDRTYVIVVQCRSVVRLSYLYWWTSKEISFHFIIDGKYCWFVVDVTDGGYCGFGANILTVSPYLKANRIYSDVCIKLLYHCTDSRWSHFHLCPYYGTMPKISIKFILWQNINISRIIFFHFSFSNLFIIFIRLFFLKKYLTVYNELIKFIKNNELQMVSQYYCVSFLCEIIRMRFKSNTTTQHNQEWNNRKSI